MRGEPAAAGGLLADEFAKVSEDSSHSSFEVVYDACDGIASRYLARPEGGPCPLTSHDSWVEREGDEEQLGHAVVAGSRDGPVEHPRFQGFGEGVALFALLRTEYDVATLGAERMNPLACLRIHELVEVLRLLPIECHHLQMIVSESESPPRRDHASTARVRRANHRRTQRGNDHTEGLPAESGKGPPKWYKSNFVENF